MGNRAIYLQEKLEKNWREYVQRMNDTSNTEPVTGNTRKKYQTPEIISIEPLEVVAVSCTNGKTPVDPTCPVVHLS